MESIDKKGLVDDTSESYWPQMLRVGKDWLNYGNMDKYSVSSKALPFDTKRYHPDEPDRMNPSCRALSALGDELVITFSTVSSCGSSTFRSTGVAYDFVLVEEAGQLLEYDVFVALVNAMSWTKTATKPLHVVLFGDFKQLPPMHHGSMLLQSHGGSSGWNFSNQVKSCFQRLYEGKKVPICAP